jgi:hypothetical protein
MMIFLKQLGADVSAKPSISVHPHRLGGMKFLFGSVEGGSMREAGMVDVPLAPAVRNALLLC